MSGTERRRKILTMIKESDGPVPGKRLATECGVSRQVIVQDMALIRAEGIDVIATNRGYILHGPTKASRIFKVCHTDEQMEDELISIVDLGGDIRNVMVSHRVYGVIRAGLDINSRRRVQEFMDDIRSGKSNPLKSVTSDYHYHLVEADNEKTLDLIEAMLREKAYLVGVGDPEKG